MKNKGMKGKATVTITIGIISFFLAFVIFMQFKFVQNTDIVSIKNMREDELREELALWKSKYEEVEIELEETISKMSEYHKNIENNEEAAKLLETELKQNKLLLGQTNVVGEGVVIWLEDGEKKVTASDLLKLVNELNLAAAEAISINNQRYITYTEIAAAEPYIYINGQRINSPFEIKAIGNKKYLESSLTNKNGFVDLTEASDKVVSVVVKDNIQIPAYSGEIKANKINLK